MSGPHDAPTLTLIEQAMQRTGPAVPRRAIAPPNEALSALIARSMPADAAPVAPRRGPRVAAMAALGTVAALGIALLRMPASAPPAAAPPHALIPHAVPKTASIEPVQTLPPPVTVAALPPGLVPSPLNATTAAPVPHVPSKPSVAVPPAGQIVLRCTTQGHVTYTDPRGSCAEGLGAPVTVYPTRGVERFR